MPNPWINKIRLLTGPDSDRVNTDYDIGTTFDKVRYSESNAFTLADFSNAIKTFFSKHMFMHYTSKAPERQTVVEWYQIGGEIPTGLNE